MADNRVLTLTLAALLRNVDIIARRAGLEAGAEWYAASERVRATWEAEANLLDLASILANGAMLPVPDTRPSRLCSIFCEVGDAPPPPAYYPLRVQALVEDHFFPSPKLQANGAVEEYARLWQAIGSRLHFTAQDDDLDAVIEGWLALLQTHTWCVPAPHGPTADISLFDFNRMAAAMAACLGTLEDGKAASLLSALQHGRPDDSEAAACLIGGDLSGVQQFLYTITSRGATPALRGRSFYLQLLTDAVAQLLLRRAGLSTANLIYSGGGRFYILAPAHACDLLDEIQTELDQLLLERHDGHLYMALAGVKLTCANFAHAQFADTWTQINQAISERKRRRFSTCSAALFRLDDRGGNEQHECQVCHTESADADVTLRDENDSAKVRKCELCRSLEELGRDLRDATAVLAAQVVEIKDGPRTWQGVLGALGCHVAIRRSNHQWTEFPSRPKRATLLGLQELPEVDEGLRRKLSCPIVIGMRWMVNVAPVCSDGRRATFADLQEFSQGIKRLGVLRMDVDDLGHLFSHGFRRSDGRAAAASTATLTRVAAFSAGLSRYFEGWVGELCRSINRTQARSGNELVYAIYSGGDDLFLVGAWDVLPDLAYRIRKDFGRYAAYNHAVHLSGAITLHGGKEPLYQAAESAGDALEAAKAEDGKDTANFLGINVHWTDWPQVTERRDELQSIVATVGAGGILSIVRNGYQDYLHTASAWRALGLGTTPDGKPQVAWGPYIWRMTYQLRRLTERYPATEDKVEEWINQLVQPHAITWLALAARWTDALTRTEKEE